MELVKVIAVTLWQVVCVVFVAVAGLYLLRCAFVAVWVLVKNPYRTNKRNMAKKKLKQRKRKHRLYVLKMHRFPKMFDFVKWVLIDVFRGKVKNKLFGIWCFTGYFGEGKTLGAVTYALKIQSDYAKMGHRIHIYTNFNMKGQDGKISCWEDLLDLPKSTIVIFDEIQSTFTSQKFKDFPIDLLWKITQCRKQQLCIFASSPVFSRMSIQLRENTDMVVDCSNLLGLDRWFNYAFYRAPEYERYMDNPVKLRLSRKFTVSIVANDYDYSKYDTTQIVDRWDIVAK